MKIWIMSDLHIEQSAWDLPAVRPDYDVLVAAGDIHHAVHGVEWLAERAAAKPVVYVPGNHEWYDRVIAEELPAARDLASTRGIHFLWDDEVTIDGVRFLGTPLWTDFELYGDPQGAIAWAEYRMNDYYVIRMAGPERRHRLTGTETRDWCLKSKRWLTERFAAKSSEKTVVVTHHLPSERSLAERFRDDLLNPAYASRLDDLVDVSGAALWVHGHTHESADYMIGRTRVVCNPKGYGPRRSGGHHENEGFDDRLVVEI
jgi:predicted phosphodiesterase